MNRASILSRLKESRSILAQRFGVREIGVFGSAARDELRPDSDIDVLVEFDTPPSFDGYFGLKDWLEQAFGREVDLVTPGGLKPRARSHVERDLIRVA
ncbi:MAG TPA: nucleotidyltransferase family protein [Burkholderiales bacterium]|nr:nucleotidyltransferase family protein [Burkholderiales bacterium]